MRIRSGSNVPRALGFVLVSSMNYERGLIHRWHRTAGERPDSSRKACSASFECAWRVRRTTRESFCRGFRADSRTFRSVGSDSISGGERLLQRSTKSLANIQSVSVPQRTLTVSPSSLVPSRTMTESSGRTLHIYRPETVTTGRCCWRSRIHRARERCAVYCPVWSMSKNVTDLTRCTADRALSAGWYSAVPRGIGRPFES